MLHSVSLHIFYLRIACFRTWIQQRVFEMKAYISFVTDKQIGT